MQIGVANIERYEQGFSEADKGKLQREYLVLLDEIVELIGISNDEQKTDANDPNTNEVGDGSSSGSCTGGGGGGALALFKASEIAVCYYMCMFCLHDMLDVAFALEKKCAKNRVLLVKSEKVDYSSMVCALRFAYQDYLVFIGGYDTMKMLGLPYNAYKYCFLDFVKHLDESHASGAILVAFFVLMCATVNILSGEYENALRIIAESICLPGFGFTTPKLETHRLLTLIRDPLEQKEKENNCLPGDYFRRRLEGEVHVSLDDLFFGDNKCRWLRMFVLPGCTMSSLSSSIKKVEKQVQNQQDWKKQPQMPEKSEVDACIKQRTFLIMVCMHRMLIPTPNRDQMRHIQTVPLEKTKSFQLTVMLKPNKVSSLLSSSSSETKSSYEYIFPHTMCWDWCFPDIANDTTVATTTDSNSNEQKEDETTIVQTNENENGLHGTTSNEALQMLLDLSHSALLADLAWAADVFHDYIAENNFQVLESKLEYMNLQKKEDTLTIQRLSSVNTDLLLENNDMEAKLAQLAKSEKHLQNELVSTKQTLDETVKKTQQLEVLLEKASLQDKTMQMEVELEKTRLKNRNKQLEMELEKTRLKNRQLEVELGKTRLKNKQLEVELEKTSVKNKQLEVELEKTSMKNKQLEVELEKTRRQLAIAKQKLSNMAKLDGNILNCPLTKGMIEKPCIFVARSRNGEMVQLYEQSALEYFLASKKEHQVLRNPLTNEELENALVLQCPPAFSHIWSYLQNQIPFVVVFDDDDDDDRDGSGDDKKEEESSCSSSSITTTSPMSCSASLCDAPIRSEIGCSASRSARAYDRERSSVLQPCNTPIRSEIECSASSCQLDAPIRAEVGYSASHSDALVRSTVSKDDDEKDYLDYEFQHNAIAMRPSDFQSDVQYQQHCYGEQNNNNEEKTSKSRKRNPNQNRKKSKQKLYETHRMSFVVPERSSASRSRDASIRSEIGSSASHSRNMPIRSEIGDRYPMINRKR